MVIHDSIARGWRTVAKILKMESRDEAKVLTPIQATDDDEDDIDLSFGLSPRFLYEGISKEVSYYKITRIFN